MQHIIFYSALLSLVACVLVIGWKQYQSDWYYHKYCLRQFIHSLRWYLYSYFKYSFTVALGFLLWPFIDHPFIFSFAFIGVLHDGWDLKIMEFIKDRIVLVELDEWLGIDNK